MCAVSLILQQQNILTGMNILTGSHVSPGGRNAKRFVQYVEDGLFCEVEGHLKTEEYNGQKKTVVVVDKFHFFKTAPRVDISAELIDMEER